MKQFLVANIPLISNAVHLLALFATSNQETKCKFKVFHNFCNFPFFLNK